MTKASGILVLAGLLFALPAHANTIQYSASGTFSASAPSSTFSASNATWAFSFQADNKPAVSDVNLGHSFDFAFSNFSYFLNSSPVAITPTEILFFSNANSGGFALCFSTFISHVGCDGLGSLSAQMYTGTESGPTLSTGAFAQTGVVVELNSTFYSQADTTLVAAAVPEPSTMILFGTGVVGLFLLGRRRSLCDCF